MYEESDLSKKVHSVVPMLMNLMNGGDLDVVKVSEEREERSEDGARSEERSDDLRLNTVKILFIIAGFGKGPAGAGAPYRGGHGGAHGEGHNDEGRNDAEGGRNHGHREDGQNAKGKGKGRQGGRRGGSWREGQEGWGWSGEEDGKEEVGVCACRVCCILYFVL